MVDALGGTIKIGEIASAASLEVVEEAFVRRVKKARMQLRNMLPLDCATGDIAGGRIGKCLFGISLYFADGRFIRDAKRLHRFLGSSLKEELASRGVKASFMGFPRSRVLPQLTHVEVLKKGLAERSAEILLCLSRERAFIAKTIAVHNPFEFQKRDVERPFQRSMFSIPPRLAKIMLNLSLCAPNKVLLDPFCGFGTILQEALLLKARVIGVDIDPSCAKAALANLNWIRREYALGETEFTVLRGDARNIAGQIGEEAVDCIVTEPDLGPALRHVPTKALAQGIIEKLMPLYRSFLKGAFAVLRRHGRLVVVTPLIRTRKSFFVRADVERTALANGFELVDPFDRAFFSNKSSIDINLAKTPRLIDMERRHIIGREFHILQKP